jgi:hypothetical protein
VKLPRLHYVPVWRSLLSVVAKLLQNVIAVVGGKKCIVTSRPLNVAAVQLLLLLVVR